MIAIGATGIGSLPGTDPTLALSMVFGEDLDTPYLPELPARGPGADMVGRAAARLVDLPVELSVGRWRLASHGGMDLRRANDFWRWGLDALQEVADGYAGPLKVALCGPWTLAAMLELPNGNVVLTDPGAVRDVHASQLEGAQALLGEIASRVPGAQPILQLDEPMLPAVLAGQVKSASGYSRLPAVAEQTAEQAFAEYVDGLDAPVVVHSCAADVPYAILQRAGVGAALVDAALITSAQYDAIGEAVDRGLQLVLGVLDPKQTPTPARVDAAAARAREIATIVAIPADRRAELLGISPACGLAGATAANALAITKATRQVAQQLRNQPE
ncbi:methionine synthase [Epidermidibacterium keratini]|uniref:Methionine synthase n=1 Tax=Epidermidibacterium keratini TaxID=1891644 RepID=A0A7L4YTA9_9ACTN|nr:methionine synthase [Epidermidibacterium keratini]QHC01767.1 methionine synthase [Epidermidibacterium keratini]